MAVSRPTDQDILDAIQEESRPTDEDILKAIGEVSGAPPVSRETQQAPAGYRPGVISPESIQRQQEVLPPAEGFGPRLAQTVKRAGAGFAQGIAQMGQDLPGAIARVWSPEHAMVAQQLDLGHPYKRIDLVKRMERAGILTEARAAERIGQRVGEIGAFLAPVGGAERGLIGLGLSARIANLVALGGATAMQASSDARAAGIPMTAKDTGVIAGTTAAGLVGGSLASKGIEAGVSKLLGSEVGKSLGTYLGHAALGAIFENLSLGMTPAERKEHALAGALAFTLGANHSAVFQGYAKARSELQWLESSRVIADEVITTRPDLETSPKQQAPERRLGVPEGAVSPIGPIRKTFKGKGGLEFKTEIPRGQLGPETMAEKLHGEATGVKVRLLQARFFYQNATIGPRMPYEAGIGSDMLTPEFISDHFEIQLEQARRIVERGTDPREAREIVQDKRQEAVLTEAEKRGPEVATETKYRLNLMDPVERLTYERKRAEFTPEQQAAVSAIPTEKEALAAMEADVASMEQELAQKPSQEERTYVLQRQAETGNLNRLQAQPEAAPLPFESRPPTEVLRTPKKAAGQAETQARIERRTTQQAHQAGQGPPPVAPPPVEPRPAAEMGPAATRQPPAMAIRPPKSPVGRVQEGPGLVRVSVGAARAEKVPPQERRISQPQARPPVAPTPETPRRENALIMKNPLTGKFWMEVGGTKMGHYDTAEKATQEAEALGFRVLEHTLPPEERIRKAVADAPHQSYGKLFEPDPAKMAQLDAERASHIEDLNRLVDKIKDDRVKAAAQRGLFDMQENLKAREAEKPQLSPEEKRRKPKPPCKG